MAPGVYYIASGSFSVTGQATLTGSGVTIVLTQNNTSGYATVSIAGNASITLSAPTSGLTAGLLFVGDRNAPNSSANSFTGGSNVSLTGALCFPTEQVSYKGGTSSSSSCTQLIARQITFTGNSQFNSNCTNTGVSPISGIAVVLAE